MRIYTSARGSFSSGLHKEQVFPVVQKSTVDSLLDNLNFRPTQDRNVSTFSQCHNTFCSRSQLPYFVNLIGFSHTIKQFLENGYLHSPPILQSTSFPSPLLLSRTPSLHPHQNEVYAFFHRLDYRMSRLPCSHHVKKSHVRGKPGRPGKIDCLYKARSWLRGNTRG